jgi:phosphoribosylanthranilate isomerase
MNLILPKENKMDLSDIKIKICGMKDTDNIREVSALKPDYMGFIFYEPSPRFVGVDFAIPEDFPVSIKRVGVFVDHSEKFVLESVIKHKLDYVQLHGDEPLAYCSRLKAEGIHIIKVFRVDEDFDFTFTKQFIMVADFFLFDTKGKLYGGNSKPFDWGLLSKYNQALPFFLSGGINPDNIESINKLSFNIFAIDVNSGAESAPGIKDVDKISEITNQLHL